MNGYPTAGLAAVGVTRSLIRFPILQGLTVPLISAAAAGGRSRPGPPCTLIVKSDGKDQANGRAAEGTMKFAANLFAALAVLLTAQTASAHAFLVQFVEHCFDL